MANHLLPPNATEEEKAIALALSRLSDVPVPLRDIWNPDGCPAELLPWLAWALSVDVWHGSWPDEKKRSVIKAAIEIHKKKGTPWAVETALEAAGYRANVAEWFEYGGEPYKFKIVVSVLDAGITKDDLTLITDIVRRTKNVRSHLDLLDDSLGVEGGFGSAAASITGQVIDIYPYAPPVIEVDGAADIVVATTTFNITTVGVS